MRRALVVMSGVAAAVVLGTAGLAWSCSAGAAIALSSAQGPPSGNLTVRGSQWWGAGEVQVRWDASDGPLLATVKPLTGTFTTTIRTPAADPGVHYVVAYSVAGTTGKASASYTVQGTSAGANPTDTGSYGAADTGSGSGSGSQTDTGSDGTTSTGSTGTSGTSVGIPGRAPAPAPATPAQASAVDRGLTSAGPAQDEPAASGPTAGPVAGPVAGAISGAISGAVGGNAPAAMPAGTNSAAGPGIQAPGGVRAPAAAGADAGVTGAAGTAASTATGADGVAVRSGSADLWSGFGKGNVRSPSDALGGVYTRTGNGAMRTAGLVLLVLGAGLVATTAGFGLAEAGRRRVAASPPATPTTDAEGPAA